MKAPNPRRAALVALSAELRPLVKMGVYENVNAALTAYYAKETGQTDFRTFGAWLDAGRPVRKGETGFVIWGKPRPMTQKAGQQTAIPAEEGEGGAEWFPVAYLFHAGQVAELEHEAA